MAFARLPTGVDKNALGQNLESSLPLQASLSSARNHGPAILAKTMILVLCLRSVVAGGPVHGLYVFGWRHAAQIAARHHDISALQTGDPGVGHSRLVHVFGRAHAQDLDRVDVAHHGQSGAGLFQGILQFDRGVQLRDRKSVV